MGELLQKPKEVFAKYQPERDDLLREMEKNAREQEIPIVGPFMGHFLSMLISFGSFEKILELGTATGYSAIWMGQVLKHKGGKLITIEQNESKVAIAKRNFQKAALSEIISIKNGKANQIVPQLQTKFDLIFMDIDKEYYKSLLPLCKNKIRKGGLLIADNTTFLDAQPFNEAIYRSQDWESINMYGFWPQHDPDMDGLCLATRQ